MKIIAVCGVGMGTSLILRMNIEEVFRQNGIEASVEHSDVSSAKGMDYDYIATSNELAEAFDGDKKRVVIINNYTDKEEIKEAFTKVGVIK